ncbi:hypothetical protein CEXT_295351 [Caerostris extrusa]|uniref:Uncharacterized protein n=1 Tax=Caerostris extrusa TaxID=172846 RepID=A0AAV4NH56_CAEEX|nr:hypothetical protein CEXT_295351 [Caerostris extrusa]
MFGTVIYPILFPNAFLFVSSHEGSHQDIVSWLLGYSLDSNPILRITLMFLGYKRLYFSQVPDVDILKHPIGNPSWKDDIHLKEGHPLTLKSSQKAKWIEDVKRHKFPPIEKCQQILDDVDGEISMDCLKTLVNPLGYMDIDHHFTLDHLSEKNDNEAILKATAQSIMEEKYPEPQ